MKWTLYHGTTESRYLSLRVADNKFTHSNAEKHLLGTGIYLYEDPTHARVWARKKPPQYEGDKPFIIAVDIELDDQYYLDLDYRDPQDWFFEERKWYRQRYLVLKQRKNARISYYTDSHFCDFLYNRFPVTFVQRNNIV
ncbi:MAG: hypothetical protein JWN30_1829 [Bacilli bacterium]|nr:hypothetical protein [Bacilli bacterium]